MSWRDFENNDPEFAGLVRERLDGVVMLGTIRKTGWPRITPIEILFKGGELYLGMMWRSVKA